MFDKLPFFFSFDEDQVKSLLVTDIPVVIPTSSAFRKYVRGVFETGCLALYEKKIKGQKIDKKMYTVVTIVIILMVETKE